MFTLEKEENNNFGVTQRAPELLLKVQVTLVFTSYLCGGPNLAVHRERGVKTSKREMDACKSEKFFTGVIIAN